MQSRRSLRILMLAPEPFFQPRGTPFSEYHRIKALVELGHHVDLVTYPIGSDVSLPNLRIYRSIRPPFVRRVPIGPSATKLVLDACLVLTALRRARACRYDLVHSHEEAGLLGVWLARRLGIPHLYDMHSSLPQQLSNFSFAAGRLLQPAFAWMERRTVAGSQGIITICQELQDLVAELGAGDRSVLIENVMGGDVDAPPALTAAQVRAAHGVPPEAPLVLYSGTFEPYQGVDLLIGAAARLRERFPALRVLFVGGEAAQVAAAAARARDRGAPAIFTGQRPASDIPAYIEACDILASPRIAGTNTPLKIYSYLRAGKPIVATDLRTHTQVLDPTVARLVPPEEQAFAEGIGDLLDDPAERARLAAAAAARAEERYSRAVYVARTAEIYARLWADTPPVSVGLAGPVVPGPPA
jgi:glycosyltransferase involved in cell wall biosynthesis